MRYRVANHSTHRAVSPKGSRSWGPKIGPKCPGVSAVRTAHTSVLAVLTELFRGVLVEIEEGEEEEEDEIEEECSVDAICSAYLTSSSTQPYVTKNDKILSSSSMTITGHDLVYNLEEEEEKEEEEEEEEEEED